MSADFVHQKDKEKARECSRYNDYRLFLIAELNRCEKYHPPYATRTGSKIASVFSGLTPYAQRMAHCSQMKTEYEQNEKKIKECKKVLRKAPRYDLEHFLTLFYPK